MYPVHAVAGLECGGYGEDAGVGRVLEGVVKVGGAVGLVAYEAVGSLSDHAQALLDGFLEVASYRHHLSYALHAGADLAGDSLELGKIPARNLADHIVKGRFEEGRRGLGDGVVEFEEPVAQTELGCDEGERVSRGLGCEG